MLIKVVLRALTWPAETIFSGRRDYNCVSFFCFSPCFPASPVTHSSTFIYGRRQMFIHWARRVTSYCAPHAAFLQPFCTCWMHSEACLEALPSAAPGAYLSHSPSAFVIHVPPLPAKSSPCSSDLLQTSSHLVLLQTVPGCCFKPSLPLWLHTATLGRTRNA